MGSTDGDRRSAGGSASAAVPFIVIGFVGIIAGGLLSALTASAPNRDTAWLTAYLVLAVGVAQIGLGLGQAALSGIRLNPSMLIGQLTCWNLGSLAVIAGTIAGPLWLVDVGGAAMVIALALFARSTWHPSSRGSRSLLYGYRILVLFMLISVPTGLVLARIN